MFEILPKNGLSAKPLSKNIRIAKTQRRVNIRDVLFHAADESGIPKALERNILAAIRCFEDIGKTAPAYGFLATIVNLDDTEVRRHIPQFSESLTRSR